MSDDPIDKHIGQRLEQARARSGKLLQSVARDLGVSYQQIRKYELGINRISASTLYHLAEILDVPTAYFFEGLEAIDPAPAPAALSDRRAAEILARIGDEEVKGRLTSLFLALEANGTVR